MPYWPRLAALLISVAVPGFGPWSERTLEGMATLLGGVVAQATESSQTPERAVAGQREGLPRGSGDVAQDRTLRDRIRERRDWVRERREDRGRAGWSLPTDRREEFRQRVERLAREIRERLESQIGLRSESATETPAPERPLSGIGEDRQHGVTSTQPGSSLRAVPQERIIPPFVPNPYPPSRPSDGAVNLGPELIPPAVGAADPDADVAPGSPRQDPIAPNSPLAHQSNSKAALRSPTGTGETEVPDGAGREADAQLDTTPSRVPEQTGRLPSLFSGVTAFFKRPSEKTEGPANGGNGSHSSAETQADSRRAAGVSSSKRSLAEIRRQIIGRQQGPSSSPR